MGEQSATALDYPLEQRRRMQTWDLAEQLTTKMTVSNGSGGRVKPLKEVR
jgi:hypothetical protein